MLDTKPTPTTAPGSARLTLEDVYRLVGALYLELEMLRRENAHLRQLLSNGQQERSATG